MTEARKEANKAATLELEKLHFAIETAMQQVTKAFNATQIVSRASNDCVSDVFGLLLEAEKKLSNAKKFIEG